MNIILKRIKKIAAIADVPSNYQHMVNVPSQQQLSNGAMLDMDNLTVTLPNNNVKANNDGNKSSDDKIYNQAIKTISEKFIQDAKNNKMDVKNGNVQTIVEGICGRYFQTIVKNESQLSKVCDELYEHYKQDILDEYKEKFAEQLPDHEARIIYFGVIPKDKNALTQVPKELQKKILDYYSEQDTKENGEKDVKNNHNGLSGRGFAIDENGGHISKINEKMPMWIQRAKTVCSEEELNYILNNFDGYKLSNGIVVRIDTTQDGVVNKLKQISKQASNIILQHIRR